MIKVLRIDDRMLHGQVAVAWTKYYQIDTIVIANDQLLQDETMQIAFKLATPPGITLSMKSLEGAIAVINNPKHAARTIMVITKNITDAGFICERTGQEVKDVLIGGQRAGDGKKQVDKNSYLDEHDMTVLDTLNSKNVSVLMQADPTSKKLGYKAIVKNYNK